MKLKLQAAMFMILIILTLPVCFSVEYEILTIKSTGQDNIENWIRPEDQVKISVTTSGGTVEKEQVRIGPHDYPADKPFDSCSQVSGTTYRCNYTSNLIQFSDLVDDLGRVKYFIKLYDQSFRQDDKQESYLVPDVVEPIIDTAQVTPGKKPSLHLVTSDGSAVDPGSGIKTIKIFADDELIEEIDVNQQQTYDEIKELDMQGNGQKTLLVQVFDGVNNFAQTETNEFEVDTSAPTISEELRLYQGGKQLIYGSTQTLKDVRAEFRIQEAKLTKVEVDASALSTVAHLSEAYKSLTIDNPNELANINTAAKGCNKVNDEYICFVKIDMSLELNKIPTIKIKATDQYDLITEKQARASNLLIDIDVPKVTFIGSEHGKFVKPGLNKIIVRITESQSGFYNVYDYSPTVKGHGIVIDASALNSKYSGKTTPMTHCNKTDSQTWECYTYLEVSEKQGSLPVYLKPDLSFDDSLTYVEGESEAILKVDNEVSSVTDYVAREQVEKDLGNKYIKVNLVEPAKIKTAAGNDYYSHGDYLNIEAKIRDSVSGIKEAYANLSSVGVAGLAKASCTNQTPVYTCTWNNLGPVTGYIKNASIYLTFIDKVGNEVVNNPGITVLENDEADANYWTPITKDPMPKVINSDTMKYTSHRIFGNIKLVPPSGLIQEELKTLDIALGNCQGSTEYLTEQGPTCLNCFPGATDLIIKFPFERQEDSIEDTNLSFNCSLKIKSQYMQKLSKLETEHFTIEVPLTSRGSMDKAVKNEISAVKGSWLLSNGFLDQLIEIQNIAEQICRFVNVLGSIARLFEAIELLFGPLDFTPFKGIAVAQGAANEAYHVTYNGFFKGLSHFCKYISCKQGFWDDWAETLDQKLKSGKTSSVLSNQLWGKGFTSQSILDSIDFKESIILSLSIGCIPGVIYNLKKARQIECRYVQCLQDDVKAGAPIAACQTARGYMLCKYVWGQLFYTFPLTNLLNGILQRFKAAISSPLGLLGLVLGRTCTHLNTETRVTHVGCLLTSVLPAINDALEDIQRFVENKEWELGGDICGEI